MRITKYIFLLCLFCSCYNERKAAKQFDKAALAYPKLPADYCSRQFPCIDSFIHGNPVYQFDTLYIPSEDTLYLNGIVVDTLHVIKYKVCPPTKIITKTITITDTVKQTDKAAIKSCEIDKSKLTDLLVKKTAESDSWQKKAKIRFWEVWLLAAIIIGYTGFKLYMALKPKISIGS